MTHQDTMQLALESLLHCRPDSSNGANELRSEAIEALKSALAQQTDADPNAPWMTEAHCLCSDYGIPHGNLTRRIRALRDKLEQQPELSTASKSEQLLASHDHALRAEFQRMKAALAQQGEQQPVAWGWFDEVDGSLCGTLEYEQLPHYVTPLYAQAAPAAQPIMETYIKEDK